MNKRLVHLIFISLLVFPLFGWAQSAGICNVKFDPDASKYFPNAIAKGTDAMEAICQITQESGLSKNELHATLMEFHQVLQQEADAVMPSLSEYLDFYHSPLIEVVGGQLKGMRPYINDDRPDPLTINSITLLKQGRGDLISKQVPQDKAQACLDDDTCWSALAKYIDTLSKVYNPLRLNGIKNTEKFLTARDKIWTEYIAESRAQTPLGIALTSVLYEYTYGKNEHDFKSPPNVQWFAMRPNVLYENVSGAVDGDQMRGTVALEVVGFNYWKDKCFGYACGASVTVNYAYRGGVEDKGYGLMFHLDNTYSVGVSKFGSESGVFFTIDLLELFKDKKASFDDYKDKYRKLAQ